MFHLPWNRRVVIELCHQSFSLNHVICASQQKNQKMLRKLSNQSLISKTRCLDTHFLEVLNRKRNNENKRVKILFYKCTFTIMNIWLTWICREEEEHERENVKTLLIFIVMVTYTDSSSAYSSSDMMMMTLLCDQHCGQERSDTWDKESGSLVSSSCSWVRSSFISADSANISSHCSHHTSPVSHHLSFSLNTGHWTHGENGKKMNDSSSESFYII